MAAGKKKQRNVEYDNYNHYIIYTQLLYNIYVCLCMSSIMISNPNIPTPGCFLHMIKSG